MDLSEEQRYAAAALFTLSLHSTQVDAGCGRHEIKDKIVPGWGEPSSQALDHFYEGRVDQPELDAAAWDAFWGWDCCGPNGLLDRVYRQLELPPRTWSGLKKLPEVAYGNGFHEFMELVRMYLAVLDTSLPMPTRKVKKRRKKLVHVLGANSFTSTQNGTVAGSGSKSAANDLHFSGGGGHLIIRGKTDEAEHFQPSQPIHKLLADDDDSDVEREVRDDLFSDILGSDKDSDLEEDLQRAERRTGYEQSTQQASQPQGAPLLDMYALLNHKADLVARGERSESGSRPLSPLLMAMPSRIVLTLAVQQRQLHLLDDCEDYVVVAMQVIDAVRASGRALDGSESPPSSICTEAPDVAGLAGGPARGPPEPSQKALAAMWELLEGCLALAHPELEVEVQEAIMQKLDKKFTQQEAKKAAPPLAISTAHSAQESADSPSPASPPTPHLHDAYGDCPATSGGSAGHALPWKSGNQSTALASAEQEEVKLLSQTSPTSDAAGAGTGDRAGDRGHVNGASGSGRQTQPDVGADNLTVSMLPRARWYDARARIALKRLAAWLYVPWNRVQNFEMLLAYQVETGEKQRPVVNFDKWAVSKRWATVAGIAVAGGGIFALVGAVVMMPLLAALPVAFFSSAGGIAAVTSTMAALGLADAGSRASRRTKLSIKEFGFMEVVPPAKDATLKPAASGSSNTDAADQDEGAKRAEGQSSSSGVAQLCDADESTSGTGAKDHQQDGAGSEDGSRSSTSASFARLDVADAQRNGNYEVGDPGHLTLLGSGPRAPQRSPSSAGAGPSSAATPQRSSSSGFRRWFGKKSTAAEDETQLLNSGQEASTSEAPKPETAKQAKAREQAEWAQLKKDDLLPMPLSRRRRDDLKLSIVIGVNGWIAERQEFLRLWRKLRPPDAEVYTLVWESKELIQLNYALTSFVTTQVAQQVAQHGAAAVIGSVAVAAVVPAIMLNTASGILIDNAWAVMVERSIKAGKLLAHTLMTGGHGDRPVVLIGYSMGARLVFHCLLELCRHKCKGIVEHAVLLGVPVGVRAERWRMARSVVSGRFVNGYSKRDWMLQVVYRTSKGFTREAGGLGPVNLPGIENVNLTGLIDGHFAYISNIDEIMELINLWPAE